MKLPILFIAIMLITGCASPSLYQWGDYEKQLYQSYKNPEKAEEFFVDLEKHINKMESTKQKVAPGLYAEVGTFYLQSGAPDRAIEMYSKEAFFWPESSAIMSSLIKRIQQRTDDKKTSVQ